MSKSPGGNPANRVSIPLTKPQDLYLQLEDYAYFHGPSQIDHVDDRFVGRRAIIERLKSLLTNSRTRSGTYLVTGYRGMGKSSFVSKVLNEINPSVSRSPRSSRYARIALALGFLSLFTANPEQQLMLFGLPTVVFAIFAVRLMARSDRIDTLTPLRKSRTPGIRPWSGAYLMDHFGRLSWRRWPGEILMLLGGTFILREGAPSRRARQLMQDCFVIWAIHLAVRIPFVRLGQEPPFGLRLFLYLAAIVALILVNVVAAHVSRRRYRHLEIGGKDDDGRHFGWFHARSQTMKHVVGELRGLVGQQLCHSMQVHVRINLGYDDLSELDVLRLVARGIHSNYVAKVRTFSLPLLSWQIAEFIGAFLFVSAFYFYQPLHEVHRGLARDLGFAQYLPSLALKDDVSSLDLLRKATATPAGTQAAGGFSLATYVALVNDNRAPLWPWIDNPPETWTGLVQRFTIYADLLLQAGYDALIVNLPFQQPIVGAARRPLAPTVLDVPLHRAFVLLPVRIDYIFWVYVALVWTSAGWLLRLQPFGLVSHGAIIARLRRLNEMIDAQISEEGDVAAGLGASNRLPFFRIAGKRGRVYQRADEREIEKQLLEILVDIGRIPRIGRRPEFVFIFDELDKIEPRRDAAMEAARENGSGDHRSAADELRSRQQNVFRLLSNLKHFLTTAQAKFIFIAGRELFDAAMADVSDRNFFIGSIFNDVIYVDSFLRDRDAAAAGSSAKRPMTQITEHFVCAALLPSNKAMDECTLKEYQRYITERYFPDEGEAADENRKKAAKIIRTLEDFITYLAYRSNGAPKKLSTLFESFVISPLNRELSDKGGAGLWAGRNAGTLYLRFTWHDQYTFGTGTHLISPFFVSLDRITRDYNDKMLVSASFLVDHLYKFHRVGFAWRNIELTPEILDVNKAPHLREVINTIIGLLGREHLEFIDNGLYQFKFRRRVSDEITVLSKLNERESAAFNFTLDESLTIKQHYRQQLRRLEAGYEAHRRATPHPDFIRSVSFVRMILGDLHFYDEEYDDAIVEYMEAIQLFGPEKASALPIELFVLLVRNTLKLGLAFERRHTYDSAMLTYGRLASRVIRFRQLRKDELRAFERAGRGAPSNEAVRTWIQQGESLTAEQSNLSLRANVLETLRLLYQPFVARFQILEKVRPAGVTRLDIDQVRREFALVVESLGSEASALARVDFLEHIGDVLFYKNGLVGSDVGSAEAGRAPLACRRSARLCEENREIDTLLEDGHHTPCGACAAYAEAFEKLVEQTIGRPADLPDVTGDRAHDVLILLCRSLDRIAWKREGDERAADGLPFDRSVDVEAWHLMARALSRRASTFVACAGPGARMSMPFLRTIADMLHQRSGTQRAAILQRFFQEGCHTTEWLQENGAGALSKIEEALLNDFLSAAVYRRLGDYRSAGWQFTKMLYVLRDYLRRHVWDMDDRDATWRLAEAAREVCRVVYGKADENLRGVHDIRFAQHREEKPSAATDPDADIWKPSQPRLAGGAVRNWDRSELGMVAHEIWVRTDPFSRESFLSRRKASLIGPYSPVNSIYNRILELQAQLWLNYRSYMPDSRRSALENDEMALPDTRAMLVADSIYCCIEILKQCGNYGLSSHIINHSLVAGAHEKCAWWIAEYRKVTVQAEEWLAAHMPSYFGQEWEQVVSERRRVEHLRSAFRQYGMALDAHRGGPAYRALIENLVYLNEDLGDDLTHFCAAQERYWLHGGRTRKRIKVLEDELAAYLKEKPVRPSRPPEPDRGQAPTRQDLRGLSGSAGEPSTL